MRGLDTELATAILSRYPSARSLATATISKLAKVCFDGRRRVGLPLARELIAAKQSVGSLQTAPFELEVQYACQDIDEMRQRTRELEAAIEDRIDTSDLGKLFTSIKGVSTLTAAAIIAETRMPPLSLATSESFRARTSPASASSPQAARSLSVMRVYDAPCGCPYSSGYASIHGWELITGAFGPLENDQKSP